MSVKNDCTAKCHVRCSLTFIIITNIAAGISKSQCLLNNNGSQIYISSTWLIVSTWLVDKNENIVKDIFSSAFVLIFHRA
jgi:hypothetical protein